MSNVNDFVIENGVLKKYVGHGGDVVIPEGVITIGKSAFYQCDNLSSITIPHSVANIMDYAFSRCKNLTSVTMPDSDIQLGDDVFSECNALFNKDGLLILNGVLLAYAEKTANIIVPEGVTCIGRKAFSYTFYPETISLPASLVSIEDSAFESCMCLQSVIVKSSKIIFGTSVFANCKDLKKVVLEAIPSTEFNLSAFPNKAKMILPPHVLETKELLPPTLAKRMEIKSPEEYAYIAVYQTAKQWADICKIAEKYAVDALTYIARLLSEEVPNMTAAKAKQLVALVKEKKEKADQQAVDSILSSLKEWATNAGAKAVLKEIGQSDVPEKKHPIEVYVDKKLEKYWLNPDVQKVVQKGIPYADGSGISSEKAVSLLLAEYQRRWVQTATLIQGDMGKVEVLENINLITISEVADKIAAALDRQKLLAFLRSLAHGANYRLFILAYARFADEAEMESFIKEISQKLRSVAKDRYWAKNAQQAMYLSETTAAIRYIDRYGKLSQYAMIHNADANTLRMERLYDLGMDATGKKVYDLGGKNLAAQLLPDLTLQLYDENAGKIVKSVPKAGSDERKYTAAKEDVAKLKKDIKEIRDTQFEKLFQAFLNGTGKCAADWERFYQSNPILRQIAELLVWAQGADTFTLREGKPINSAGQEYVLNECMVTLAHPMEMGAADVTAWQGYFAANQIKQPFNQIWEPVIDFSQVTSDRYVGVEIPAYRFKGQEKHGITFQFDYGNSDLDIGLTDCTLYLTGGTALGYHSLDIQGSVQLYTFQVRQKSRASNHIIGLLDKWAVYSRILKDDASIADQLPQFTLAQIEEFLKLAMENNCTSCTAALLEFKNVNFAGFDPMAEFTLEL